MQRKLLLLLLHLVALPALALTADDAPWCPSRATWVYRKSGMTSTSYYRYEYVRDTVLDGRNARKLSLTTIHYYAPPGFPPAVAAGAPEYYAQSHDSVYWWNGTGFQFLYHFAAQAGDRWVASNRRYTPCPAAGFPQQDTLRVRSISDVTLGGRVYQRYDVRSDSQYFQTGPVLRNIGSLLAPFPLQNDGKCFLMQHPDGAFDPTEFDALICYYDDLRGFVPVFNGTSPGCTTLMNYILAAMPTNPSALGWKAGPNPAHASLQVSGAPAQARYRLCSIGGQTVRQGRLGNGLIGLEGLAPGLYLLELSDRDRITVWKVVKR